MKHKVQLTVETEKRGLFGKRKVQETKTVWMDGPTYRRWKKEQARRPFTLEELLLYDELLDDD